jgi:CRP/FNR family transcriptional regulator, anaerobic regulatory protein
MDCTDVGLAAADSQALPAVGTPGPAAPAASGLLCMRCDIRARCLGGIAAEAGTAQLQAVLAGRTSLRAREVLYRPGETLQHVHVVRRGALVSTILLADGEQVSGFHFPGELIGVDALLDGRHRARVAALEPAELCTVRFAPRPAEPAGVRALLARLWDMMSVEVVRERAHQGLLATLAPPQRVAAFLASVAGRARGRAGTVPLHAEDVASYLRLAPEMVERLLAPGAPGT